LAFRLLALEISRTAEARPFQRAGALAAERIKNEPPRPEYRFHILSFAGNFAVADWAKEKASKTPPYMDWDDYLPMVRDYVAVEKHLYPHMNPRIYGVAWEVNLNMPPTIWGRRIRPQMSLNSTGAPARRSKRWTRTRSSSVPAPRT